VTKLQPQGVQKQPTYTMLLVYRHLRPVSIFLVAGNGVALKLAMHPNLVGSTGHWLRFQQ
tara:strand:+ start:388 stop:567 length:180 start_codon:yes stop_codon:yes gene_type:complete